MQPLILASSSPRRKELLQFLQIPFESMNSNVDESIDENMCPDAAVKDLASRKAEAIAAKFQENWVIGSDTVVVLDGEILGEAGKPGRWKKNAGNVIRTDTRSIHRCRHPIRRASQSIRRKDGSDILGAARS